MRNQQTKGQYMNRRTGKVARLPADVREEINRMLDDGKPYRQIIDSLAGRGHPGINAMNLSNWKAGGFQDWLRERQRLRLAQDIGTQDPNALVALADARFLEILQALNGADLGRLLQGKPEQMVQLMRMYVSFSRHCLDREKHEQHTQSPQAAEPRVPAAGKNPPASAPVRAASTIVPLFPVDAAAATSSGSSSSPEKPLMPLPPEMMAAFFGAPPNAAAAAAASQRLHRQPGGASAARGHGGDLLPRDWRRPGCPRKAY
jgi:hypothetical protein